ncbi:MAG: sigma-70 family RNA polymerase sigma factor [Deltaproteobacteria bacterium]|nr:sigma-70 family RNA polymerase sigma factor [Deltaproteobacteria bacterium]
METLPKSRDFQPAAASNLSEKELIQGLREKADWAFRELISRWSDKLYRLSLRFVKRPEEAQEIVQEVLLKVVEKIDTFEGSSSLYTWLYRVTVNESLMRLRPDKGKKTVSWEEVLPKYESGIHLENFSDWSKLPDEKFVEKEFQQFVQESIELLPDDLKTAYLLKDVEQLPEEEVCKILELTKPAMKNRVHRARLFLRKRIEERYVH